MSFLTRIGSSLLLLLLSAAALWGESPNDLPNVVLVMADDQGWGDTGLDDHPFLETPHLRQLARDGFRFRRFYAAAPVCSPTRASVLTGRHPNRMGVFQWGYPLRPQEETLAEIFSDAGYHTAHFGKWHLGSLREGSLATPSHAGFQHWVSAPNFYDNDPVLSRNGTAVAMQGESSQLAVELALEWIAHRPVRETPFLAVIWLGSPHLPHRASDEDQEVILRRLPADMPEPRREKLSHFLGEVRGIDRAVGRLRGGLKEMQLEDQTLVWYTSDNGALPGVGSTGGLRGQKNTLYEGGLRVPSLVSWPGRIPANVETWFTANSSDLLPTLISLCGLSPRADRPLDGIDLSPVFEDPDKVRSEGMGFWHLPFPGRSVPGEQLMREQLAAAEVGKRVPPPEADRLADQLPTDSLEIDMPGSHAAWIEGDWKLHRRVGETGRQWELYDLASDPGEKRNVADQQPLRVVRMQRRLDSWMESVGRSYLGEDYAH